MDFYHADKDYHQHYYVDPIRIDSQGKWFNSRQHLNPEISSTNKHARNKPTKRMQSFVVEDPVFHKSKVQRTPPQQTCEINAQSRTAEHFDEIERNDLLLPAFRLNSNPSQHDESYADGESNIHSQSISNENENFLKSLDNLQFDLGLFSECGEGSSLNHNMNQNDLSIPRNYSCSSFHMLTTATTHQEGQGATHLENEPFKRRRILSQVDTGDDHHEISSGHSVGKTAVQKLTPSPGTEFTPNLVKCDKETVNDDPLSSREIMIEGRTSESFCDYSGKDLVEDTTPSGVAESQKLSSPRSSKTSPTTSFGISAMESFPDRLTPEFMSFQINHMNEKLANSMKKSAISRKLVNDEAAKVSREGLLTWPASINNQIASLLSGISSNKALLLSGHKEIVYCHE
jgi:hypothetical protein